MGDLDAGAVGAPGPGGELSYVTQHFCLCRADNWLDLRVPKCVVRGGIVSLDRVLPARELGLERSFRDVESVVYRRRIPGDPDAGVRRLVARANHMAQRPVTDIPGDQLRFDVCRTAFRPFVGILAGLRQDRSEER